MDPTTEEVRRPAALSACDAQEDTSVSVSVTGECSATESRRRRSSIPSCTVGDRFLFICENLISLCLSPFYAISSGCYLAQSCDVGYCKDVLYNPVAC